MRADGLPEGAPYNEDGYSVPIEYFKYNQDWRRLVREFQEDLGAGRYEPEWQAQAAQAMEERARGDFDKYKDDQFEQFWGQKQKTPWRDLAGESSNIKLDDLVENNIIREGDIFSYSRVIGKGKERILIEKDSKILRVDGTVLTMAIPPGRLKYARHLPTPQTTPTKSSEANGLQSEREGASAINGVVNNKPCVVEGNLEDVEPRADTTEPDNLTAGKKSAGSNEAADEFAELQNAKPLEPSLPECATILPDKENVSAIEARDAHSASPTNPSTPTEQSPKPAPPHPSSQAPAEDAIFYRMTSLNEFDRKLIEVDGRLDPNKHRNANTWKSIRGKRDNQDLGTLFEMREEFFVWKSPTIVKTPKKTRSGREVSARKRT